MQSSISISFAILGIKIKLLFELQSTLVGFKLKKWSEVGAVA
jgi:hypothetical protein